MFGRTTARRFGSPARTPGPGDYARTPGDGTEPAHARHRSPTEEVMKSQVDEVARELETAGQAATRLKNDLDRLRDERDAWRRAATEAREAESQASARLRAHRDELVELGKGLNAEANRAETIVALERDLASCRGDLRSARAALAEQEAVAWKRKKEEASRASADERVRQLTTAWERKTEEVAAASRASADERVRQLTDELAAQRIEHKKLQVAMEKLHSKHAQLTRKASDDEAHRSGEVAAAKAAALDEAEERFAAECAQLAATHAQELERARATSSAHETSLVELRAVHASMVSELKAAVVERDALRCSTNETTLLEERARQLTSELSAIHEAHDDALEALEAAKQELSASRSSAAEAVAEAAEALATERAEKVAEQLKSATSHAAALAQLQADQEVEIRRRLAFSEASNKRALERAEQAVSTHRALAHAAAAEVSSERSKLEARHALELEELASQHVNDTRRALSAAAGATAAAVASERARLSSAHAQSAAELEEKRAKLIDEASREARDAARTAQAQRERELEHQLKVQAEQLADLKQRVSHDVVRELEAAWATDRCTAAEKENKNLSDTVAQLAGHGNQKQKIRAVEVSGAGGLCVWWWWAGGCDSVFASTEAQGRTLSGKTKEPPTYARARESAVDAGRIKAGSGGRTGADNRRAPGSRRQAALRLSACGVGRFRPARFCSTSAYVLYSGGFMVRLLRSSSGALGQKQLLVGLVVAAAVIGDLITFSWRTAVRKGHAARDVPRYLVRGRCLRCRRVARSRRCGRT